MANAEHFAKLDKSSRDDWNQWRASQSSPPNLCAANLHGKELVDRNLRDADLKDADLSDTILGDADLKGADLRGADLRRATFDNTNLSGTILREANLQAVDLSVAQRGLQTEQLAGADLTGSTLPPELAKLYDSLENVNNISESARKLFLAVLAACLYSWLTIATTTDVGLITNRASSPLPIIQTSIPIVGFYWVAPLLLLCVYFYFHFYLQKLWEELGSLPAIFPDGRPLHTKIDPWLLNDLVRSHLPKLNINRPFLSYFQLWISVLLAWWVVPITMFLFWGRYLPRRDRIGTTFHVLLFAVSVTAAFSLYRLAVATLRGVERKPFEWKSALTSRVGYQTVAAACGIVVFFGLLSIGAIWGVRSSKPIFGHAAASELAASPVPDGPHTWVPRAMALIGLRSFANLESAELSEKKSTWSGKQENYGDSSLVIPARLSGADLRYVSAGAAFLAFAELDDADLSHSSLNGVDLRRTYLTFVNLRGATLFGSDLRGAYLYEACLFFSHFDGSHLDDANLTGAHLRHASFLRAYLAHAILAKTDLKYAILGGADLTGTVLRGADLTYSDFRGAKNLDAAGLKAAKFWDQAFYDTDMLIKLGLPLDHDDQLEKQLDKDDDLVTTGCAPPEQH